MGTDPWGTAQPQLHSPAEHAASVTPHDSTELTNYTTALYVGGEGDLKVTTVNDEAVTFSDVPVGTIIPVRVKLVWSTGTTATNILALY